MPSFDIVSEVNQQEVKNAHRADQQGNHQPLRLQGLRRARGAEGQELTVYADDEFKLGQVHATCCAGKLAKRNVDVRCLEPEDIEKISRRQGEAADHGARRHRAGQGEEHREAGQGLARSRSHGSIQGDAVRISGAKKDDLQAAIQLVRKSVTDIPAAVHELPRLRSCVQRS